MSSRPPFPPFTRETAIQKVRMAEDAWNSRDPERVALAYTVDTQWRNRAEFIAGREEIVASGSEGMLAMHEPDQLVGCRLGGQIQGLMEPGEPLNMRERTLAPFRQLADGWIHALRTGEEASPSFDDGVKVQEVLDAVGRSQQLSRWMDLSGKKWPV